MGNIFILVLLISAVVVMYFVFFSERKQPYSESKVRDTFVALDKILNSHEDDHPYITRRKEKITEELKVVRREYNRSPSEYTQQEITAFEKLLPELKQELREFCDTLIDIKPKILAVIQAEKRMLQAAQEAMKTGEKVKDNSNEHEDVMDTVEKILEFSPAKIKEKEDELLLLEKSIARYTII